MPNLAKGRETKIEFEEAFTTLKTDIKWTRIMLASFFVVTIVLKPFLKLPIPYTIPFVLFVWFLAYFVLDYLLNRTKNLKSLYNFYFGYGLLDLVFLTAIVHWLGGVEWIGVVFYIVTILHIGIILPKKRALIFTFIAFCFYISLVLFEYLGFIPHEVLFPLKPGLYRDPSYIITVSIAGGLIVFYFAVETSSTFSEMLRKKRRELEIERNKTARAYKEVEEARAVLEIKVEARTKELKALTESLDAKVKQRTKELQEKIKELERFHKLAVGRELKMIELKKEIEKLKGLLKSK